MQSNISKIRKKRLKLNIETKNHSKNNVRKNNIIKLRYICILVVVFIITIGYKIIKNSTTDAKEILKIQEGISALKTLENKNISSIENNINKVREELSRESKREDKVAVKDEVDINVIFKNTVFMGDSISEALSEYEMLQNSSVVATKGRDVIKAKQDINTVVNLNPQNIIMLYGMNDLLLFKDTESFIKHYEELIKEIKDKLPNVKIYINSIFPVRSEVSNKEPSYENYDDFNAGLQDMCGRLSINFIDTAYLVKENNELYEQDGIHLIPKFYPKWLDIIKEKAKL